MAALGAGQGSHANVDATALAEAIGIPVLAKTPLLNEKDELEGAPEAQYRPNDVHNDQPVKLTIGDRGAECRQGHQYQHKSNKHAPPVHLAEF